MRRKQYEGTNEMEIRFDSRSENEGFARVAVASFMTQLNPTVEEVGDVKTAVSEAVTNAIIHGYDGRRTGKVCIRCKIRENIFTVEVSDSGKGIRNIAEACSPCLRQNLNRTVSMGFSFMEAFMDSVDVESEPEKGTSVRMTRTVGKEGRYGPHNRFDQKSHAGDKKRENGWWKKMSAWSGVWYGVSRGGGRSRKISFRSAASVF